MQDPLADTPKVLFAIPKEEIRENPLYQLLRGKGRPLWHRITSPSGMLRLLSVFFYTAMLYYLFFYADYYTPMLLLMCDVVLTGYLERTLFLRYRDNGLLKEMHLAGIQPVVIVKSFTEGVSTGALFDSVFGILVAIGFLRIGLSTPMGGIIIGVLLVVHIVWFLEWKAKPKGTILVKRQDVEGFLMQTLGPAAAIARKSDFLLFALFIIGWYTSNTTMFIAAMAGWLIYSIMKRKSRLFQQQRNIENASPEEVEQILIKIFHGEPVESLRT